MRKRPTPKSRFNAAMSMAALAFISVIILLMPYPGLAPTLPQTDEVGFEVSTDQTLKEMSAKMQPEVSQRFLAVLFVWLGGLCAVGPIWLVTAREARGRKPSSRSHRTVLSTMMEASSRGTSTPSED